MSPSSWSNHGRRPGRPRAPKIEKGDPQGQLRVLVKWIRSELARGRTYEDLAREHYGVLGEELNPERVAAWAVLYEKVDREWGPDPLLPSQPTRGDPTPKEVE